MFFHPFNYLGVCFLCPPPPPIFFVSASPTFRVRFSLFYFIFRFSFSFFVFVSSPTAHFFVFRFSFFAFRFKAFVRWSAAADDGGGALTKYVVIASTSYSDINVEAITSVTQAVAAEEGEGDGDEEGAGSGMYRTVIFMYGPPCTLCLHATGLVDVLCVCNRRKLPFVFSITRSWGYNGVTGLGTRVGVRVGVAECRGETRRRCSSRASQSAAPLKAPATPMLMMPHHYYTNVTSISTVRLFGISYTAAVVFCHPCAVVVGGVLPTETTMEGLTNGLVYSFQVVAVNAFGNSARSLPSNKVRRG